MKYAIFAATALAVALLAGPAAARNIPAGGMTTKDVADWLHGKGMQAKIQKDSSGNTIVSSSMDGTNFEVYFYACNKGRCASIQYAAGFEASASVTATKINQWDREKRYIRAYLNEDGSIWAEFDIDVSPGGTYAALDNSLARYRSQLADFRKYMGI